MRQGLAWDTRATNTVPTMGCMWITCIMHEENSSTRALSQNSANLKKGGGCHFFPFLNSSKFVTGKVGYCFHRNLLFSCWNCQAPGGLSIQLLFSTKPKKKKENKFNLLFYLVIRTVDLVGSLLEDLYNPSGPVIGISFTHAISWPFIRGPFVRSDRDKILFHSQST